jgi:hypothetical protein
MSTLSPVDRVLWGGVVRRNLAVSDSKLTRMLPKYGARGATLIFVAQLWLGLGSLSAFAAEMSSFSRTHASITNSLWILAALLILMAIFHCARGSVEGKHFRASVSTRT